MSHLRAVVHARYTKRGRLAAAPVLEDEVSRPG
jgi:hypothetical protein